MSESGAAENIPTREEVDERLRQGADWRHFAVCTDEDPELFFPTGTSGPALLQVEQAKAVCRRCPVAEKCLQWALGSGQDAGVWGGKSEDERRALKRRSGLRVIRAQGAAALSKEVEEPSPSVKTSSAKKTISHAAPRRGGLRPVFTTEEERKLYEQNNMSVRYS